mgnify:CR=1 FL=1
MASDCTVAIDNGFINLRVGAIIMKNGKFLMVGNQKDDYLYSVGGRIKFGETAEEAVVREVYEETGRKLEIDRLGFIHENFFYGDYGKKDAKLIYEVSYFFYMKTPEDFEPVCESFTDDKSKEKLNDDGHLYIVIRKAQGAGSSISKLETLFKIQLPIGFPAILVGIASSFSLAFKVEIMSEILTGFTKGGLGSLIKGAQLINSVDLTMMFGYSFIAIIFMIIITYVSNIIKEKLMKIIK